MSHPCPPPCPMMQAYLKTVDMTQAPYPCIDQCRPKLSDTYRSSYKNANDFPHTRRWQLSTYTNSSTFWSPFLCIKPLQCPVFLVCPAYYCLYPCSHVTSLSLIIFKIIPHPMTLLTAFPLQVIIQHLILYCLFSLIHCHITYPLSSSHILSPRVCLTCHLNPFS
jgi:hypothetical protein